MTLRAATGSLRTATGSLFGQINPNTPRSAWTATVSATTTSAATGPLPWAMPSRTTMRNTGRDVLAYFHTFPIYPTSSGNTNNGDWLLPSSEPGTGGKWRQRPYPIIEGSLTNALRIQYAKDDIAVAANIGIDGFTFNILSSAMAANSQRMTEHILPYYDAAAEFSQENSPGFSICPNPSMLSWLNNSVTPTEAATALAPLLTHPAAYKRSGRPVIIFYNVGNMSNTWYRNLYNLLLNSYDIDAAMIASHQSNSPTGAENMENYSDLFLDNIFTGLHPWNAPLYSSAVSGIYSAWRTFCASSAHPAQFMCSVGPRWENDRPDPTGSKQIEGKGLQVIENSWRSAINNNDPMVQIVSWSDHLESHNVRPSTGYQYVPLDFTAYFLAWYKRGLANPPTILRDAVYYAHRMHLESEPSSKMSSTARYTVDAGGALDQVIVHAFLTAPADVTVTIGSTTHTFANVPAGVTTLPRASGDPNPVIVPNVRPRIKVIRSGTTVVDVTSAFQTRTGIEWQDLLYRMGSSTRDPLPLGVIQNNLPQDRD